MYVMSNISAYKKYVIVENMQFRIDNDRKYKNDTRICNIGSAL